MATRGLVVEVWSLHTTFVSTADGEGSFVLVSFANLPGTPARSDIMNLCYLVRFVSATLPRLCFVLLSSLLFPIFIFSGHLGKGLVAREMMFAFGDIWIDIYVQIMWFTLHTTGKICLTFIYKDTFFYEYIVDEGYLCIHGISGGAETGRFNCKNVARSIFVIHNWITDSYAFFRGKFRGTKIFKYWI